MEGNNREKIAVKRRGEDKREEKGRWERKGGKGKEKGNNISFTSNNVRVKYSWYVGYMPNKLKSLFSSCRTRKELGWKAQKMNLLSPFCGIFFGSCSSDTLYLPLFIVPQEHCQY